MLAMHLMSIQNYESDQVKGAAQLWAFASGRTEASVALWLVDAALSADENGWTTNLAYATQADPAIALRVVRDVLEDAADEAFEPVGATLATGLDPVATTQAVAELDDGDRQRFADALIDACDRILADAAENQNQADWLIAWGAANGGFGSLESYVEHSNAWAAYDALNRASVGELQKGAVRGFWQWGEIVLIGREAATKEVRAYIDSFVRRSASGLLFGEEAKFVGLVRTGQLLMVARGRGLDPGRIDVLDRSSASGELDRTLREALGRITKKKVTLR
ncbi:MULTISPECIES: hypothetical protein [unclassified Amycolatopsis]|uniref:hypothetical protein n=1 Tax=unclassified Amycolatopsis TaxID=2618356 RepID=UPI002E1EEF0B|nr:MULTISPECIES: hypothetical protein [unclassified Amycolatopsis]